MAPTPEPTPDLPTPEPLPPSAEPVAAVTPDVPAPPPPVEPPAPVAEPAPAPPPPAVSGMAGAIVDLINQRRAEAGVGPVSLNAALTSSASDYATVQFQYGPMSLNHELDGTALDRAVRNGYSGGIGEVLAAAQPSAQTMVDLWMASPPHRAIILDGNYRDIGVGCAEGPLEASGATFQVADCVAELGYQ